MFELKCSSFEEFAGAIRGADTRIMLAGPETSEWWIRYVSLPGLGVQVAQEGAANIVEAAGWSDAVNLLIGLDGAGFSMNGVPFSRYSLGLIPPGRPFTARAFGKNVWATVSFPAPMFEHWAAAPGSGGRALSVGYAGLIPSQPLYVVRLGRLLERVIRIAQTGSLPLSGRTAQATKEEILYVAKCAMADDGRGDSDRRGGRPALSRRTVLDRVLDWIAAHRYEAVHVSELASAARVSERTLRSVFRECFGIGPLEYLRLRQVHEVREILRTGDPEHTTVAGVALRLGVWDVDAMAGRYRRVFGECPVATLRRPGRHPSGQALQSSRYVLRWRGYHGGYGQACRRLKERKAQ